EHRRLIALRWQVMYEVRLKQIDWTRLTPSATCKGPGLNSNEITQHQLYAVGKGGLPPLNVPFHSTLRVGRLSGGKPPFPTAII
ncbi:MAG TPA: hypothetical protein VL866_02360, partial [Pyrinomonadaceae bacterium]|nr:hypothetical protein [Pyrinomonadaceae bacterium]